MGADGRASAGTIVLNETAADRLGFASPNDAVGQLIWLARRDEPAEVVGVARDYRFDLPTQTVGPMVLYDDPARIRYALVRAQPGALSRAETLTTRAWNAFGSVHPVAMQRFETQISESQIRRTLGAFRRMLTVLSLLAILISCLGLLGMAAYHVESRVKEVGVRKVLGSSRAAIVWLLSREFVVLTLAAAAVAVPLTLLLAQVWLGVFAVRVGVSAALVGGCVLLTGLVALGVVASQTLRAASADPVASLRDE